MVLEADSAIPLKGYFHTSCLLILTTIVAFDSVIVSGLKLYGIYKMPSGPIENLFLFKSIEKIFASFASSDTYT
jgi:hypothetical protein